jgi:hypothetical protein
MGAVYLLRQQTTGEQIALKRTGTVHARSRIARSLHHPIIANSL